MKNQKIMREEYDRKKLKVKRRGLLPELKDEKGEQAKIKDNNTPGLDFSESAIISRIMIRMHPQER